MTAKSAVIERIRAALLVRYEYSSRSDKPNEPPADFLTVMSNATVKAAKLRWSPRQSDKGVLAVGAEDEVFEFDLTIMTFAGTKTFYCKGFFSPKGSAIPQGVEIQSFRRKL